MLRSLIVLKPSRDTLYSCIQFVGAILGTRIYQMRILSYGQGRSERRRTGDDD